MTATPAPDSTPAPRPDAAAIPAPEPPHAARNRRYWETEAAAAHGPLARGQWARAEHRWGLWETPDTEVGALPAELSGVRVIELGCGTAYVSARLARAGARPVGVDLSAAQLATARAMQVEFGIAFPLLHADAERVPCADGRFDLVVSDYGASLWCDPCRWVPEAARLLVPGGRLVFSRYSPLLALCVPDGGGAAARLLRPQFGMWPQDAGGRVEFVLPHGEMLRTLRASGFVVEDLTEIRAPHPAHRDYAEVSAAWARSWPSEEIWRARLAG